MGTTRRTSIEAYHTIKENGLLTGQRWEVYEGLIDYAPATAAELTYEMGLRNLSNPQPNGNIRARLSELREMGVAVEVRERVCTRTGMTVIEWDVADKLPEKLRKKAKQTCLLCGSVS